MRAGQRECAGIMIKGDIFPAGRYMADGAIASKLAVMMIVFRMTGKTILWGAFENVILMTGIAIQLDMITDERKCRCVMIEFRTRPFRCLMTCSAIPAELTLVDVLGCMTGKAILWSVFVFPVYVTGFTADIDVRTCQLEVRRIVIELSRFPGISCMTLLTRSAKLTHMRIDLLMA